MKKNILRSALLEFKQHGYRDASMRQIAHTAGITPGNIYRYFASKEAILHELIQPTYERFVGYVLEIRRDMDNTHTKEADSSMIYLHKIQGTIVKLFNQSSPELSILLNRSEGSKYENVKQELTTVIFSILEKAFHTFQNSGSARRQEEENQAARMIAATIVEGMCIILRDYEDGDTIERLVDELIRIYFAGIGDKINRS
ncbi:TetR/AcrR family transcriptional regulator [Paenibacillus sepulcri]|uniref:TetR/AcrR family transcriptional regulator n=1 Tax=Paenibacillus sepulcri TaxID=359917 RepID=A0ABS7CEX5_9BACL|nr:TetR/AcrR family transcriptional regulator [Paenibacillus sepulcri]